MRTKTHKQQTKKLQLAQTTAIVPQTRGERLHLRDYR